MWQNQLLGDKQTDAVMSVSLVPGPVPGLEQRFQKKGRMNTRGRNLFLRVSCPFPEPREICVSPCDAQAAPAGCYKALTNTCPCKLSHCVFEPLIYGGCLPGERNVIGHFFVVVKITS